MKKEYRRFNITGVTPGDDYGALRQALRRRYERVQGRRSARAGCAAHRRRPGPDQRGAMRELEQLGFGSAQAGRRGQGSGSQGRARNGCSSMAMPAPSCPGRIRQALRVIQRIRDEAHRFAITGHRKRRARRHNESVLETVPGLGPAKRRALLRHFGGMQGLLRAGVTDFEAVSGIGTTLARTLYDHLHPGPEASLTMIWNLPNTLTWLRIFAIPLVIVLFYLPYQLGGSGRGPAVRARRHHRLARRLPRAPHGPDLAARRVPRSGGRQAHRGRGAGAAGEQGHAARSSCPGSKAWTAVTRRCARRRCSVILVLCSIVIIGREIAISALREWMAEIGQRGKVKVSQLAKYKTILQIVGLSCMLFRWNLPILPGVSLPIFEIGLVLTVVAAVLTLISAISYLRAAWPDLRGHS